MYTCLQTDKQKCSNSGFVDTSRNALSTTCQMYSMCLMLFCKVPQRIYDMGITCNKHTATSFGTYRMQSLKEPLLK